MKAESSSIILIMLLTLSSFGTMPISRSARASSTTVVPFEFATIQEAIENAAPMDTIIVYEGVYNETVSISKSISLIGEDGKDVIIDAGRKGYAVSVYADNVTVRGFKIRNGFIGIYVDSSDGNTISGNSITTCDKGIVLSKSNGNRITNNALYENYGNGIELQGSNHNQVGTNKVTKNPAFGIYLTVCENNTIVENEVTEICTGISLENTTNNRVVRNTVADNSPHGIYLNYANNNTIDENTALRNNLGIQLLGSDNNDINRNNITLNNHGFVMTLSEGNVLKENRMTSNLYNFGVFGNDPSYYINEVDDSNFVDGKPIFYLVNQRNKTVPTNAGYVVVFNSTNVLLSDLNLTKNMHGILLAYSFNVTIQNVTVAKNFAGGLFMWSSKNSTIKNTQIYSNIVGISLHNSSGNRFYHNNIANNLKQVESTQSINAWDNGYPAGGNYWGENNRPDEMSGPSQKQLGADGTLDSAYIIDSNNRDGYPSSGPIIQFRAGTWNNIAYFVEVASNSRVFNFRFDPAEGPFVKLNVSSLNGAIGFAKVVLPKQLLYVDSQDEWKVFIEDKQEPTSIAEDDDHTYLYFKYEQGIKNIRIEGTRVISQENGKPSGIGFGMIWVVAVASVLGCLILALLMFARSRKDRS